MIHPMGAGGGVGVVAFSEPSTNVSEHYVPHPVMMEPRHRCGCGKACYPTEGAARRAVKTMRTYGKDRRYLGVLHPYLCPERRSVWHVGHSHE